MRPWDAVTWIEVHLLVGEPALVDRARASLDLAHIVIYQPISETYQVDCVRKSQIQALTHAITISFPVVYFSGLQPDIIYVGGASERTLSPLGPYNSRIVLLNALARNPPDVAISQFNNPAHYGQMGYFDVFESSLLELARRDGDCDIKGEPILRALLHSEPTMYTINHPMNSIMASIVSKAFLLLGLKDTTFGADHLPSPLSQGPIWPPSEAVARFHQLHYGGSSVLVGETDNFTPEQFVYGSYIMYQEKLAEIARQAPDLIKSLGYDPLDYDKFLRMPVAPTWSQGSNVNKNDLSPAPMKLESLKVAAVEAMLYNALEAGNHSSTLEFLTYLASCDHFPEVGPDLVSANASILGKVVRELLFVVASPFYASRNTRRRVICWAERIKGAPDILQFLIANCTKVHPNLQLWIDATISFRSHRCFEEAAMCIQEALRIKPEDIEAMTLSAHVLLDQASPIKAFKTIQRLIEIAGDEPHLLALGGYALFKQRRFEESASFYELAIQREPGNKSFGELLDRSREALIDGEVQMEDKLDFAFKLFTGHPTPSTFRRRLEGVSNPQDIRRIVLQDPKLFTAVPAWRLAYEIGELRAARASGLIRLVIGAAGTTFPGWVSTNEELLDLLGPEKWLAWLDEGSVDAMLAEHVWEHLSAEEGLTACHTCYRFLLPGGHIRIAVPDALMPSAAYQELCKVGGHDGHKMSYDYRTLSALFTSAGYQTRLLEFWDEGGNFHEKLWDSGDGHIGRCRRFDPRNSGGDLTYTSLIVDGIKPQDAG